MSPRIIILDIRNTRSIRNLREVAAIVSPQSLGEVRTIMSEFAARTGLLGGTSSPQRYLWTDAFAVCNFLSLSEVTGDDSHIDLAIRLIDQVHQTLGRHREDDARSGWISGLDDEEGRLHPTAGGLRIGKRVNERPAGQAHNEPEEWDRDGQYFHYLTKWMHALARTAAVTADAGYLRWALELAQAAHSAFVYAPVDGATPRMYWKMSIDLSRPLVSSMGHHDPLDALVTYSELEHCHAAHFPAAELPGLRAALIDAAAMCAGRSWVTDDPLGIGGMLADTDRMSRLQADDSAVAADMVAQLLADARTGLHLLARVHRFDAPAEYRLAFRELGLSIGLHAVEALHQRSKDAPGTLTRDAATELEALMRFVPFAESIESFWRHSANRSTATWRDHLDINSVMLGTSLLPEQFLIV